MDWQTERVPPPADDGQSDCYDMRNKPNLLLHYDHYSFSACVVECHASFIIERCGCRYILHPRKSVEYHLLINMLYRERLCGNRSEIFQRWTTPRPVTLSITSTVPTRWKVSVTAPSDFIFNSHPDNADFLLFCCSFDFWSYKISLAPSHLDQFAQHALEFFCPIFLLIILDSQWHQPRQTLTGQPVTSAQTDTYCFLIAVLLIFSLAHLQWTAEMLCTK